LYIANALERVAGAGLQEHPVQCNIEFLYTLLRKDSDDMGSVLELLVEPLKHTGTPEMMLSGQPTKGVGLRGLQPFTY
jgi:hypothetical protein